MLYTASWAGVTVLIHIDDAALKDRAERFLALAMTPAPQSTVEPAITVSRDDHGWHFTAPIGPSFLENDDDAVILLTMLLADAFELRSPYPVLHAGAFVADGGAVIYLADLAQGKSSHTFAAWRRGYAILGDDRIALRLEERAAQAIPKCVKLRIHDSHVPCEWRDLVANGESVIGGYANDRRWMISRGLPRVTDCESLIPIHAIALLRRIEEGPSHVDRIPLSAVIQAALDYMTLGDNTPMDVLRFMKGYALTGKLPRVNVAPGDMQRGVELLAGL